MICTVSGKFLSTTKGTTKAGKNYSLTRILCGDEVVKVWDCDCSACSLLEDVDLRCKIFFDRVNGTFSFRAITS